MEIDLDRLAHLYCDELLNEVVPFWQEFSPDNEFGGYFSCLDPAGKVFDSDKFVWLQGRQVWMFAKLYNRVEKRPDWLAMARQGAEFLLEHGHDGRFDFYFRLDRQGRPLEQPHSIFSNTFAAIGFAELYFASNERKFADAALKTFQRVLDRQDAPEAPYGRGCAGVRDLKAFALPMILCNTVLEMEPLLGAGRVEQIGSEVADVILKQFYRPEFESLVEHVTPSGGFSDSFEGRLINPGHGIEAMWFLMDLGVRLQRREIVDKAVSITLSTLEKSWDREFAGIYYFLDCKGHPPEQLDWNQKLWWVHLETIVALLKGFQLTGSQKCWEWFETVHEYTWDHFRDQDRGGEWFGYLDRRGKVLLPIKGGKWKGCFHVPRALLQSWRILEDIAGTQLRSPR